MDWRSGSLARLSLNFLGSNVPSPPEPSPYFIIGKNEQNEQNEMCQREKEREEEARRGGRRQEAGGWGGEEGGVAKRSSYKKK